jgi:uncharacterized protein YjaG (DUF416 family)
MLYKDFVSLFRKQVYALSYEGQLSLALAVCKRMYFDYEHFVEVEQWGDSDLLMDTILHCDRAQIHPIAVNTLKQMREQIDAITPDTEDFGDYLGTYALNAAASVYEIIQFQLDKNPVHVYRVGIYYLDTTDFKIQEKESLWDEQIDEHPMTVEARNFLLEHINVHRTKEALQNGSTSFSFKKLLGLS